MIWDMPTVHAIRGYRAEVVMDPTTAEDPTSIRFMTTELFNHLRATIQRAWPIEIDPSDCITERTEGTRSFLPVFTMRWDPQDRPGEIMGGTHDAQTIPGPDLDQPGPYQITIQDKPIKTPHATYAVHVTDPITGEHPVVTATHATTYTLDGWSDLHRRWIYIPKGTR